jgi:hypothetical protein
MHLPRPLLGPGFSASKAACIRGLVLRVGMQEVAGRVPCGTAVLLRTLCAMLDAAPGTRLCSEHELVLHDAISVPDMKALAWGRLRARMRRFLGAKPWQLACTQLLPSLAKAGVHVSTRVRPGRFLETQGPLYMPLSGAEFFS